MNRFVINKFVLLYNDDLMFTHRFSGAKKKKYANNAPLEKKERCSCIDSS